MSLAALAAPAAAPRAFRAHLVPKGSQASSHPWRRTWKPSRVPSRGTLNWSVSAHDAETREAHDPSTSAPAGTLSIIDSTDDVFSEFCDAQVELVARALGRGARCMLYLRASGVDGENLQLTEVASYPPSQSRFHFNEFEMAGDTDDIPVDAFQGAASSFTDSLGGVDGVKGEDFRKDFSGDSNGHSTKQKNTSITLTGGGSVDDGDGVYSGQGMTAAEALLVKQRVFALPSTNALVVPLSRDDILLGLLVGEMPDSGGWKGNSARTRKERERKRKDERKEDGSDTLVNILPEVEVLSASSLEDVDGIDDSGSDVRKTQEAQDTAEKFGDRRRGALAAAARSVVAAWAMHRRADYATAAAMRSDERVEGFTTAAREPLTVLRTLGGMLSSHLKKDTPSKDMAEAIVAQGDVLAQLSSELESALYPTHVVQEVTAPLGNNHGGKQKGLGGGSLPALPAPKSSGLKIKKPQSTTATSEALALGEIPSCDITPIIAGLLASAEVMAKPTGVTMTATFPDGDTSALVKADPRDVRETLALVIDAALVAAPTNGNVDVLVRANGGQKGGVVIAVGVTVPQGGLSTDPESKNSGDVPYETLPAGAFAAAAATQSVGDLSYLFSETSIAANAIATRAANKAPVSVRRAPSVDSFTAQTMLSETPSLQIARSLVEGAGGIFHVLPSLPPAIGRVEMWLPAAEVEQDLEDDLFFEDEETVMESVNDTVDVYSA